MAARNFAEPRALQRELILIEGSFAPNGASAVAASSRIGPGWSVARSGVGIFTVTFSDKYVALVSATATLQLSAVANSMVQLGVVDLTAKTAIINVLTAGVAADIAANANNRIHFQFAFSNTSMVPSHG